ncbi:hypothetical protein [Xylanibacillus composti]|nr:hypothetical protein [Xylanibacillus composti]
MKKTISPIVMSGEEPIALNRWLIKKVQNHHPEQLDAEPAIDPKARVLLPWEQVMLQRDEVESNWRFYISERADRYLEVNEPFALFSQHDESSYMYACCSVHCLQDREMLVNLICYYPSPVRVWINGRLVFTSHAEYVNREVHARVPFHEGFNTILVECPLHLDRQLTCREFIIKLNPFERLTDLRKQNELVDQAWLEQLKHAYHIIVDSHAVCKNDDQVPVLKGMAQPMCFSPESLEKSLELHLWDAQGQCLAREQVQAMHPFRLSFPQDAQGFYRITLTESVSHRTVAETHCCMGHIADAVEMLRERIRTRKDCNETVLESLRGLAAVPSLLQGMNQYVPADWMEQNLKLFYEASVYAGSADQILQVQMQDVFPERYSIMLPKSIDSGELIYTVHLPEQYDSSRLYPVVFYFHDAQGRKYPLPLPWMQWARTSEAIVVDMVGISRLHFADDIQVVRMIQTILGTLPADRDRIYGIGFCTGGPKTYRIGFLVPHLFAALASIVGDPRIDADQPEYEFFDNLEHTAVLAVCGVENWFFNSMRKADFVERLPKGETWMIHGFIHNECSALFNSRPLFHRLLEATRTPLPKSVKYVLIDPAFNHSYWIDEVRAIDFNHKHVSVQAQIVSREKIIVRTVNVKQCRLLLAQEEMELDCDLTLLLNGREHTVKLTDAYSALSIACTDTGNLSEQHWELWQQPLTRTDFKNMTDRIVVEDDLLGIKKAYVRNCTVVKPDRMEDPRRRFHMKLAYLLQNPFRDRYIAYNLESCSPQEWADSERDSPAYVHLLDMRNLHDGHKQLLHRLGIHATSDEMICYNRTYKGEYAAVLWVENDPSDQLLVAYNSDSAGEALLDLWNTFDENPLFYQTSILWHDGRWFAIKPSEATLCT